MRYNLIGSYYSPGLVQLKHEKSKAEKRIDSSEIDLHIKENYQFDFFVTDEEAWFGTWRIVEDSLFIQLSGNLLRKDGQVYDVSH